MGFAGENSWHFNGGVRVQLSSPAIQCTYQRTSYHYASNNAFIASGDVSVDLVVEKARCHVICALGYFFAFLSSPSVKPNTLVSPPRKTKTNNLVIGTFIAW